MVAAGEALNPEVLRAWRVEGRSLFVSGGYFGDRDILKFQIAF